MAKKQRQGKNDKNNDKKCLQDAVTVALYHRNIERNPQRILKFKSFID